jgi:hypothetical protein
MVFLWDLFFDLYGTFTVFLCDFNGFFMGFVF